MKKSFLKRIPLSTSELAFKLKTQQETKQDKLQEKLQQENDKQQKLNSSIKQLSSFMINTNLKFNLFTVDWPVKVLSENLIERKHALDAFYKRLNLNNQFIPSHILIKYMLNHESVNSDCFDDLCLLNRKYKQLKLNANLVDFLLNNKNNNSNQAKNLELLIDSFDLIPIDKYLTIEFILEFLNYEELISIKNFLFVFKIAVKKRVACAFYKRFLYIHEILFHLNDIDFQQNEIEVFLTELFNQDYYSSFKLKRLNNVLNMSQGATGSAHSGSLSNDDNSNDVLFYDTCLNKSDYELIFYFISSKSIVKDRCKKLINEFKLASINTNDMYPGTFQYLLQIPELKFKEGNLKKLKSIFDHDISDRCVSRQQHQQQLRKKSLKLFNRDQNEQFNCSTFTLKSFKPELLTILLQLNDENLNKRNIKRILNCEHMAYVNKVNENDIY